MVNSNKLKGIFKSHGLTIAKAAEVAGISPATMTRNLRRGIFRSDEIEMMIRAFKIEKPMDIFFEIEK